MHLPAWNSEAVEQSMSSSAQWYPQDESLLQVWVPPAQTPVRQNSLAQAPLVSQASVSWRSAAQTGSGSASPSQNRFAWHWTSPAQVSPAARSGRQTLALQKSPLAHCCEAQ